MSYGSETNGIGAYGAESSSGGGGQPEVCPIGETWDSWDLNPREGGDTYNLDYSTLLFDGASISISTEMRSFLFNGNTGIGGTPIHALFGTQQCALWLDSKSNNTASLIVKYGSGISQTPFRTEYSKVNLIDAEVDFSGVVSDGALVLTGSITAKLYVGGVLLDTISTSGSFTRSSAVIRVLSILTTMPDVFNGTIVGQGFPNQCKAVHQYLGNYDVTLNLSMQIRDNWNGNNTIFDYGSTADTYTFDGDLVTTDYDIWERLNGNSASVQLASDGFNPFGTQFLTSVVGKRYPRYKGRANLHGEYQEWSGEMIMDSSGGYSYNLSSWVPTYATGFGIAGMSEFPVPLFTPKGVYSVVYNRICNVIREYDSGESSEQRKFTMKWENLQGDALRCILVQIITVIRGNTFKIDFGDNLQRLSPWLPREGEILSGEYDIRLASSVIKYTYTGGSCSTGGAWDLEIECIKWES